MFILNVVDSQVIGWKDLSDMTYYVSSGMLNSTYSLTDGQQMAILSNMLVINTTAY